MHTPAADNRVAILTPDPADGTYADAWPEVLDRLANALAGADVAATPIAWTAHVDDCARLQEFPLVLPLLAGGYHLDHARWLRACRTWQDAGVAMENPADVLAWNYDKRYLETLRERGIAIPATTWSDRVTRGPINAMPDETGAEALNVTPTVCGAAWKTRALRPRGGAAGPPHRR